MEEWYGSFAFSSFIFALIVQSSTKGECSLCFKDCGRSTFSV